MSKLEKTLNEYVNAGMKFRDAAIEEVTAAVRKRYPTAVRARVTGIITEDYSEHDIVVYDAAGEKLNHVGNDDWPWESEDEAFDEDWFTTVTEGVCVFEDHITIPIPREEREG